MAAPPFAISPSNKRDSEGRDSPRQRLVLSQQLRSLSGATKPPRPRFDGFQGLLEPARVAPCDPYAHLETPRCFSWTISDANSSGLCLPPYLLCDQDLLVAQLRTADGNAMPGVLNQLKWVVAAIRERWPGIRSLVPGESIVTAQRISVEPSRCSEEGAAVKSLEEVAADDAARARG